MLSPHDSIARRLSESGYRMTRARRAIINTLISTGGHLSADLLFERVHREAPFVGRMTVYRTLDLLTDLGLARPVFQGTGAAHYVLMIEGGHHHLICSRCHRVFDFEDCSAGELLEKLAEQYNFSIHSHLLEAHGICSDCIKTPQSIFETG